MLDRSHVHVAVYVYDWYPNVRPASTSHQAPHCNFESLYVVEAPSSSSWPKFCLYPQVSTIVTDVQARADSLADRSKPVQSILPKPHRLHAIGDAPDFTQPFRLNPDFVHITRNETVSGHHCGQMTFNDMGCLETCAKSLLQGQSYSLWMLSGIMSFLKQDGFQPLNPVLFDALISSLSVSVSSQEKTAAAVMEFLAA